MAPKGRRRRHRDITARDLADYGSPAAGTVNIDAAARGMGVARSSIRRALSRAKTALSKRVFENRHVRASRLVMVVIMARWTMASSWSGLVS
jgi:hypothetical protein